MQMRSNLATNEELLAAINWSWQHKSSLVDVWFKDGLPCAIFVGPFGSLNGYVGVPERHIWYGREYSAGVPERLIEVHGGLTFSGDPEWLSGKENKYWWFGFDTNHAWDFSPGMYSLSLEINNTTSLYRATTHPDTYIRTIEYVRSEVNILAHQLAVANVRGGMLYTTD